MFNGVTGIVWKYNILKHTLLLIIYWVVLFSSDLICMEVSRDTIPTSAQLLSYTRHSTSLFYLGKKVTAQREYGITENVPIKNKLEAYIVQYPFFNNEKVDYLMDLIPFHFYDKYYLQDIQLIKVPHFAEVSFSLKDYSHTKYFLKITLPIDLGIKE